MGHPWHRGVASNDNLDRTELDDFPKQLQEGGRVEIVEGLADKPWGYRQRCSQFNHANQFNQSTKQLLSTGLTD